MILVTQPHRTHVIQQAAVSKQRRAAQRSPWATLSRPVTRTPPKAIWMALAEEVGFGCPVEGCGIPYLTWHHFDPPWKERQHHDPRGMIALCEPHHSAADVGAYTSEQLREMKAQGRDRARALEGRFEWRRRNLLAVVGGLFLYEVPVAVRLQQTPLIWFNRDDKHQLLLNVAMPSTVEEPRLRIDDNFWIEVGNPKTVECPPSGKLVSLTYPNGDAIRVEFFEVDDGERLSNRYRHAGSARQGLAAQGGAVYPLTVVEIRMCVLAPDGRPWLDFNAQETRVDGVGGLTMSGIFSASKHVALQLD
jgi:hypothetical protein